MDFIVTLAVITLCFVLVTQLVILSSLRSIKEWLVRILEEIVRTEVRQSKEQFDTDLTTKVRRVKYRASSALSADIAVAGQPKLATVNDISETGALISLEGLEIGASYPITIKIPDGIGIQARIRVIRKLADDRFGVSFESLSIEAKKKIREFVQSMAGNELNSDVS